MTWPTPGQAEFRAVSSCLGEAQESITWYKESNESL